MDLGLQPTYRVAEGRRIEAAAKAAHPGLTLMDRAGHAIARLAMALQAGPGAVVVVAGSGNNGGDGWVTARHLRACGVDVAVWEPLGCAAADALQARQAALQAGVPRCEPGDAVTAQPSMIVDALLGWGVRAPLTETVVQAVAMIGRWADGGARVLAVDVPSGLDADTGNGMPDAEGQPHAVRADHTLCLLALKPGLYTQEGRGHAGRIWFDALGCGELRHTEPVAAHLTTGRSLAHRLDRSRQDARGRIARTGHKGLHGDTWVLGGAPGMEGAALLAARAALQAGSGRVYRVPLSPRDGLDPAWPEVMVAPIEPLQQGRVAAGTWVVGCGAGTDIARLLPAVMARAPRLVLDADALNAVAAEAGLRQALKARQARGCATILTPHPLEAARLLNSRTADVQGDRLAAAAALADELGCTVVLKGAGTVTASPGRTAWLNGCGNARLSTAGTGDVLAGWIGGAWRAAAMPVHSQGGAGATHGDDPHDLAAACVERHARASEILDDGAAAGDPTAGAGAGSDGGGLTSVLRAGRLIEVMALVR